MDQSEWKIAKRLYFSEEGKARTSRPAVRVALGGILIGVMVMIVAICVVVGFKQEIQRKVAGFGSHIQVVNFDNNATYELQPVEVSDSLLQKLRGLPYVKQVSTFASKPGILKTDSAFQGIIFKGTDYWDYFAENLVSGSLPEEKNEVIISTVLANQLHLAVGDAILCYFVQEDLRVRKLYVSGLYNTCMSEMDRLFVLGDIDLVRQLNHWRASQASGIEVLVDDLRHLQEAADGVYFATANRLDEAGNAFYTQTLEQLNPQIFGWLDLLDMNVVIIIVLMLCVSGFSIITGLIILILESITLIGTLKALGAHNRFVRRIFIYEAILLVGKGMLWGNVLGLGLVAVQYFTQVIPLDASIYYVSYVPMAFPWGWLVALNIGVLLVAWVIMLAPSAIVSQISPAKVMHFE
ncbi:MAG: ABC transporter permease [Paludibacteraceae bacterium]|nr:ABC transporter permease [Paludibacteraceae bacterium]